MDVRQNTKKKCCLAKENFIIPSASRYENELNQTISICSIFFYIYYIYILHNCRDYRAYNQRIIIYCNSSTFCG